MSKLKLEIDQAAPFDSPQEEVYLNLLRSADALSRNLQRRMKAWGVTSTQYNVLRILRGAGPRGLTCASIRQRMITVDPDITRLLNRLKAAKLVRQSRDRGDRRVVWTQITAAGLELLGSMQMAVQLAPIELLRHMSDAQVAEFNRLLELAREGAEHLGTERPTKEPLESSS